MHPLVIANVHRGDFRIRGCVHIPSAQPRNRHETHARRSGGPLPTYALRLHLPLYESTLQSWLRIHQGIRTGQTKAEHRSRCSLMACVLRPARAISWITNAQAERNIVEVLAVCRYAMLVEEFP